MRGNKFGLMKPVQSAKDTIPRQVGAMAACPLAMTGGKAAIMNKIWDMIPIHTPIMMVLNLPKLSSAK